MRRARLRQLCQGAVYFAALLGIALAGCSQERLPPVATLTAWQAPGITQVSSVFGLHNGPGNGVISHVSTYLANTGEPHILLTEDSELFDVRLDGAVTCARWHLDVRATHLPFLRLPGSPAKTVEQ
jgi:hypothetical protein